MAYQMKDNNTAAAAAAATSPANAIKEDREERNVDRSSESGFYCEVCDCIVKDSLNYLDHVNGKKHNRNLGISLRKFVDCSFDEVKAMLERKKRERDDKVAGINWEERDKEEEERRRRLKRDKRKRQQARRSGRYEEGEERDEDDEDDDDDSRDGLDTSRRKRKTCDRPKETDNQADDADEMAKLMGFSSFSTSKR